MARSSGSLAAESGSEALRGMDVKEHGCVHCDAHCASPPVNLDLGFKSLASVVH